MASVAPVPSCLLPGFWDQPSAAIAVTQYFRLCYTSAVGYRQVPVRRSLPTYQDASEASYNTRAELESEGFLALMDKKNIPHGGGHNKIEFCDLYSAEKDIIHVKRYGGSSPLSHLFAQGLTSGELFQVDRVFRTKVNEHLPPSHQLADPDTRPEARDYCVVFAIVSQSSGPLQIPFFATILAARNSPARRLRLSGCIGKDRRGRGGESSGELHEVREVTRGRMADARNRGYAALSQCFI